MADIAEITNAEAGSSVRTKLNTIRTYINTLKNLTGLVKVSGEVLSAAAAGTDYQAPLSKAAGSDINTGTDDYKFATSKAIADSNVATIYDAIAGIRAETDSFTLSASYINHLHRVNKATGVTITFPKNATVVIPVNSAYAFEQTGAGVLTLAPVDGDVTLNSNGGALKSWGQYSVIYAIKVDTNVWTIYGGSV